MSSRQGLLRLGCQKESAIPREGHIRGSQSPPFPEDFWKGRLTRLISSGRLSPCPHTLPGVGRGLREGRGLGEGAQGGVGGSPGLTEGSLQSSLPNPLSVLHSWPLKLQTGRWDCQGRPRISGDTPAGHRVQRSFREPWRGVVQALHHRGPQGELGLQRERPEPGAGARVQAPDHSPAEQDIHPGVQDLVPGGDAQVNEQLLLGGSGQLPRRAHGRRVVQHRLGDEDLPRARAVSRGPRPGLPLHLHLPGHLRSPDHEG